MARIWYAYVGGNPQEPSSWFRATVKPSCVTGSNLCAIYAYSGDINPAPFSINLSNYISNALISSVPQPSIPATKKYIYLKN